MTYEAQFKTCNSNLNKKLTRQPNLTLDEVYFSLVFNTNLG